MLILFPAFRREFYVCKQKSFPQRLWMDKRRIMPSHPREPFTAPLFFVFACSTASVQGFLHVRLTAPARDPRRRRDPPRAVIANPAPAAMPPIWAGCGNLNCLNGKSSGIFIFLRTGASALIERAPREQFCDLRLSRRKTQLAIGEIVAFSPSESLYGKPVPR